MRPRAKFGAKVTPQGHWNHPKGTKQTPAHAQKTDMKRQAQLVGVTPACVDCLALSTIEGEKCLHLEVADIAGQLAHPKNVVCQPCIVNPISGRQRYPFEK